MAGGYVRHMDSYSLGAARALMPHSVASMDELNAWHTSWDVMAENTTPFVTFGGVPAENAEISNGGVGEHRVRRGLTARGAAGCRFVRLGPVRDNPDHRTRSEERGAGEEEGGTGRSRWWQ